MKRQLARVMLLLVSVAALWPTYGYAFCGFYVARADSTLWGNHNNGARAAHSAGLSEVPLPA